MKGVIRCGVHNGGLQLAYVACLCVLEQGKKPVQREMARANGVGLLLCARSERSHANAEMRTVCCQCVRNLLRERAPELLNASEVAS